MIGPGTAAGTNGATAFARSGLRLAASIMACLVLAACAQTGTTAFDLTGLTAEANSQTTSKDTRTDLAKATDKTGKEYVKDPRNPDKALAYARNLKALGEKRQALAVLQQASIFSAGHRGLNSEYGRLALDLEQVSLAQRLLEAADDPANPDWRVISARGTVLAKQGRYREAIPLYERALTLAPSEASVLNNLALAQAMEGHADRAEVLLRRASTADGYDPRVSQNLSLVLGLQGKYDEARQVASRDQPADNAAADIDYLRRIVMLEPRVEPRQAASQPDAPANISKAAAVRPDLRGPALDGVASGWAPKVAAVPREQ